MSSADELASERGRNTKKGGHPGVPGPDRGAGRSGLVVRELTQISEFAGLETDWKALQGRAGRVPFSSFEWNAAWWNHLARRGRWVRDHIAIRTVRDAAGALLGVAPVMMTETPGRGPVRFRCLQLFGADPNITEVRTMLLDPERATEVYAALFDHFESMSRGWDWIRWSGVPVGGPVETFLESYPRVVFEGDQPECLVEVGTSWQAFKSSRSRNIKESLRKCQNSLARDGRHATLRVAAGAAELAETLPEFFRLHEARSTRTNTIAHADFFVAEQMRQFISDVAATSPSMRLFMLNVGDRARAARIGFVERDSLYLYYSGYEPAFSRYSIMTNLVAEAIKYAIEHGLRTVNLSPGVDVSKSRWSPSIIRTKSLTIPSRRALGRLSMRAYSELQRLLAVSQRASARIKARRAATSAVDAANRTP